MYNPTRNFQKCTKSHEELSKMHKIPRGTSKNAQNPMRNFQICTKSHQDLSKMHKIPCEIPKRHKISQNPMRNEPKNTTSCRNSSKIQSKNCRNRGQIDTLNTHIKLQFIYWKFVKSIVFHFLNDVCL